MAGKSEMCSPSQVGAPRERVPRGPGGGARGTPERSLAAVARALGAAPGVRAAQQRGAPVAVFRFLSFFSRSCLSISPLQRLRLILGTVSTARKRARPWI